MHLIVYFSSGHLLGIPPIFILTFKLVWVKQGPVDAGLEESFAVGWEDVLSVLPMPLPVLHLQWGEEVISVEPQSTEEGQQSSFI